MTFIFLAKGLVTKYIFIILKLYIQGSGMIYIPLNDFSANTLYVSINLSKLQLSQLFQIQSKPWVSQPLSSVQYMMKSRSTFSSWLLLGRQGPRPGVLQPGQGVLTELAFSLSLVPLRYGLTKEPHWLLPRA